MSLFPPGRARPTAATQSGFLLPLVSERSLTFTRWQCCGNVTPLECRRKGGPDCSGGLARLIQPRRAQTRLTQQQVAEALRVLRSTYAEWERGMVAVPERRVEALAASLRIPVEQAHRRWEADRQILWSPRRRRLGFRAPTPCGTLPQMLALTPDAAKVRCRALDQGNLTSALEQELLEASPRLPR